MGSTPMTRARRDGRDEHGRRNGVPGELLIRVTPTYMVAKKDVAE